MLGGREGKQHSALAVNRSTHPCGRFKVHHYFYLVIYLTISFLCKRKGTQNCLIWSKPFAINQNFLMTAMKCLLNFIPFWKSLLMALLCKLNTNNSQRVTGAYLFLTRIQNTVNICLGRLKYVVSVEDFFSPLGFALDIFIYMMLGEALSTHPASTQQKLTTHLNRIVEAGYPSAQVVRIVHGCKVLFTRAYSALVPYCKCPLPWLLYFFWYVTAAILVDTYYSWFLIILYLLHYFFPVSHLHVCSRVFGC